MAKKFTCEIITSEDKESVTPLVEELLSDIRPQDMEDLEACGHDVTFVVIGSIKTSDETRIYRGEDGKLLCLFGKGWPSWEAPGRQIWMLGTNELYKGYVKSVLFTEARRVLKEWVMQHGIVHNIVYEKNMKSVKYLSRLGARWCPECLKNNGKKFYEFFITEVRE